MKNNKKGILYLIPTTLGENEPMEVLPISVKSTIEKLDHFIVENEKTARRFIKRITPDKQQSSLKLFKLDKHAKQVNITTYLDSCEEGIPMGVISEAGVPGVADPGADIVMMAHQRNIKVVPLVGPSSILLAIMSSGLNGQNFAFNGYLPIDSHEQKRTLKSLEKISKERNQSQIFIETPYRNEKLFTQIINTLSPNSYLCIACDITLESEYIKTLTISQWKKSQKPDLHKRPTIFIIHG
ncbi:MAG: SAM-dependent methyltransferase [Flavobacteriaceae bacterium]|nr:SAM-dependent methyltransferase [Flavobacteriaceae bacterium]